MSPFEFNKRERYGLKCTCGFQSRFFTIRSGNTYVFTKGKPIIGHCDRCGEPWMIDKHVLEYKWDADDMQGHGLHFFEVLNPVWCKRCHARIVALNLWCNEEEWNAKMVERMIEGLDNCDGETSMSADWSEE